MAHIYRHHYWKLLRSLDGVQLAPRAAWAVTGPLATIATKSLMFGLIPSWVCHRNTKLTMFSEDVNHVFSQPCIYMTECLWLIKLASRVSKQNGNHYLWCTIWKCNRHLRTENNTVCTLMTRIATRGRCVLFAFKCHINRAAGPQYPSWLRASPGNKRRGKEMGKRLAI